MTVTLLLLAAVAIALSRAASAWWLCRTPIERVNRELVRARARRRR
jgi:hypothetical protein